MKQKQVRAIFPVPYPRSTLFLMRFLQNISVADLGFPRGGCANPMGAPTYYWPNFSRKLHENEEILAEGGRASLAPPLRSATAFQGDLHMTVISLLTFREY